MSKCNFNKVALQLILTDHFRTNAPGILAVLLTHVLSVLLGKIEITSILHQPLKFDVF